MLVFATEFVACVRASITEASVSSAFHHFIIAEPKFQQTNQQNYIQDVSKTALQL
jgi:hypothetical protein